MSKSSNTQLTTVLANRTKRRKEREAASGRPTPQRKSSRLQQKIYEEYEKEEEVINEHNKKQHETSRRLMAKSDGRAPRFAMATCAHRKSDIVEKPPAPGPGLK